MKPREQILLCYKLCLKVGNADAFVCLFPSCCPSDIVAAVSTTKHPIRAAAAQDLWGKLGAGAVGCCHCWEKCQGSNVKPAGHVLCLFTLFQVWELGSAMPVVRLLSLRGNPRGCLHCATDTTPALPQETLGLKGTSLTTAEEVDLDLLSLTVGF